MPRPRASLTYRHVDAVVVPDGDVGAVGEGVEDAYGEGLGLSGGYLFGGPPFDGGGFVGGGEDASGEVCAEDEGDDTGGHVLVDAGEPVDADLGAGFFADLSSSAVGGRGSRAHLCCATHWLLAVPGQRVVARPRGVGAPTPSRARSSALR